MRWKHRLLVSKHCRVCSHTRQARQALSVAVPTISSEVDVVNDARLLGPGQYDSKRVSGFHTIYLVVYYRSYKVDPPFSGYSSYVGVLARTVSADGGTLS